MSTVIGVYADWSGLTVPLRLGWRHARSTRQGEKFEFENDSKSLEHPALVNVQIDPGIQPFIGPQQRQTAEQAAGDAVRDQRIRELAKRLDDYQNGSVRMGDAIHELRAVVAPLPDKLLQLEQRDPDTLSFDQAAKLVQMGASIDELTQACGLTQAEAQLMSRMHGGLKVSGKF